MSGADWFGESFVGFVVILMVGIIMLGFLIPGGSDALSDLFWPWKRFYEMIRPTPAPIQEYEIYESAFNDTWHNGSLVGLCSDCGCDDAPLVTERRDLYGKPTGEKRCKWCQESKSLNNHLERKSTRPAGRRHWSYGSRAIPPSAKSRR